MAGADVGEHVGDAIAARIGFVCGRRAEEALAGTLAIGENLFPNPDFLDASAA